MTFFDILYQRYSAPDNLMNGMIRSGQLESFVHSFVKRYNDEEEDRVLWDIWLHKDTEMTYPEFKQSVTEDEKIEAPTQDEIVKTLDISFDMLNGFDPDGGVVHGDLPAAWDGGH